MGCWMMLADGVACYQTTPGEALPPTPAEQSRKPESLAHHKAKERGS